MATQSPPSPADQSFEQHAREVLTGVQTTIRSLFDATPGVTRRAIDLQRTLGIDHTLAWQIHKAAYTEDPFTAGQRLAGRTAMNRFLTASAKRGAPQDRVDAVRSAIAQFEKLVTEHAGSKSEFETILSGLSSEDSDPVGLPNRRAAFQAQRHLLGVYADSLIATYIWAPSLINSERIDNVGLRTLLNLRRLRKGASVTLAASVSSTDSGKHITQGSIEPLVPGPHNMACDLIPEFCSMPLPDVRQTGNRESRMYLEVKSDTLGVQSAGDFVVGQMCRSVFDRSPSQDNQLFGNAISVRTPCELLVLDVLLHKDLPPLSEQVAAIYTDHRCQPDEPYTERDCDLLPISAEAVYLGTGMNALAVPEMPRYRELVGFACERLGFDADEFEVHQCRIEFPPLPSTLTMISDRLSETD